MYEIGDAGWRWFQRDACAILAGECPDAMPAADVGDHSYFAYIEVDGVDALHAELTERGADLIKPLRDEPWGMREFGVRTIDGHRIMFGARPGGVRTEQAVPVLPGDDLGVAKAFYVGGLGFSVRFESTEEGRNGMFARQVLLTDEVGCLQGSRQTRRRKPLYEQAAHTARSRSAEVLAHPPEDRAEGHSGYVSEGQRHQIAGADFTAAVDVQVSQAGAAAECLRRFQVGK